MTQDFNDFEEDFVSDVPLFSDEVEDDGLDLDSLRRQSERTGSAFDDMETDADSNDDLLFDDDEDNQSSSRFSFGNFTAMQRLILAILVLLDFIAIIFGVLVLIERVG